MGLLTTQHGQGKGDVTKMTDSDLNISVHTSVGAPPKSVVERKENCQTELVPIEFEQTFPLSALPFQKQGSHAGQKPRASDRLQKLKCPTTVPFLKTSRLHLQ